MDTLAKLTSDIKYFTFRDTFRFLFLLRSMHQKKEENLKSKLFYKSSLGSTNIPV